MGRKEKAIEFIKKSFGEATASQLSDLEDDECISKARSKISGFLGEKKAQEFDIFIG